MFELLDNIEMPAGRRTAPMGRRKYDYENAKIGQMFFVPGKSKTSMATHSATMGKKLGFKFVTRSVWMKEDEDGTPAIFEAGTDGAVEGVGVWRVA